MARKAERTFFEHPSSTYIKVVAALKELMESEGLNTVSRAYAEATCDEIQRQFSHGMSSRAGGHVCVYRLQGKRCQDHFTHPCDSPSFPGKDHLSEWVKGGGTEVIVSQPYSLSYTDIREIVEYCERMGLQAEISASHSWHFPGQTIAVEYRRNNSPEGG